MDPEVAPPRSGEVRDGRSVRWADHNLARRNVIINAAISVLEEQQPGDELQVLAVAERAGLARTVIYRHFEDRADLDRAVQRLICEQIGATLLDALAVDASPEEMIRRTVPAFVHWCVENPALFWFAERDLSGWGPSPLNEAFERLAEAIEMIVDSVVAFAGVDLDPVDRASVDPWVFGIIGGVLTACRRWSARDPRNPQADDFARVLSDSVWVQINGVAALRGIALPATPVADILDAIGRMDG